MAFFIFLLYTSFTRHTNYFLLGHIFLDVFPTNLDRFSEPGISHDGDGRSVISAATTLAVDVRMLSHKPQLGDKHSSTLSIRDNLVSTYGEQGWWEEDATLAYDKQLWWEDVPVSGFRIMRTAMRGLLEDH
jgi:hypothetical protein